MENEKKWDLLFEKLDNMTEEEFIKLADELDALGDIPFAIGEAVNEIITSDNFSIKAGTYSLNSDYNNQSQYEVMDYLNEEMAA
jgi:hypothetical protein